MADVRRTFGRRVNNYGTRQYLTRRIGATGSNAPTRPLNTSYRLMSSRGRVTE